MKRKYFFVRLLFYLNFSGNMHPHLPTHFLTQALWNRTVHQNQAFFPLIFKASWIEGSSSFGRSYGKTKGTLFSSHKRSSLASPLPPTHSRGWVSLLNPTLSSTNMDLVLQVVQLGPWAVHMPAWWAHQQILEVADRAQCLLGQGGRAGRGSHVIRQRFSWPLTQQFL